MRVLFVVACVLGGLIGLLITGGIDGGDKRYLVGLIVGLIISGVCMPDRDA